MYAPAKPLPYQYVVVPFQYGLVYLTPNAALYQNLICFDKLLTSLKNSFVDVFGEKQNFTTNYSIEKINKGG